MAAAEENHPQPDEAAAAPSGCLPALVMLYVLATGIATQLLRLALLFLGRELSYDGALILWILLAAPPLALLVRRSGAGWARDSYTAWLLAFAYPIVMMPVSWPDPDESQLAALLRVLLAALFLVFLRVLLRRTGCLPSMSQQAGLPLALLLAAPLAYPWLVLGALGSPTDILLDLLAGLLFGWTAALLIVALTLQSATEESRGYWVDALTGALAGTLVLLIMSVNFGFNGGSLILVIALPLLAWPAAGLARLPGGPQVDRGGAAGLFLGLCVAYPLLFADTDMLALRSLFTPWETIHYALLAALLSATLALPLFIGIGLLRRPFSRTRGNRVVIGMALVLWLAVLPIYIGVGTPGLFGDRLFVILEEQANVARASEIADYDARRLFVYENLVAHAESSQADLRGLLDIFWIDYTPYYLVNAIEVRGGLLQRLLLSFHPDVARVLPSPVLRPLPFPLAVSTGPVPSPSGPLWNQEFIQAPTVWQQYGVRGAGIVIGQSDSGVQWDHPELRNGYRGLQPDGELVNDYNWLDPWLATPFPTDPGGHGTHTLGIASGDNTGMAPDATWIACRNLLRNIGNPALYLDCLQFMLAPYPSGGDPFHDGQPVLSAHVLNNSWGCPEAYEGCDATALRPAVNALRAAGIFFVAAAGNDGPACGSIDTAPALYQSVFTVGALNQAGRVAAFSSVGPAIVAGNELIKPDLLAPGENILSAYPRSTYSIGSGTSQASPHVAGVVALMWSANPALVGDIERTEELLFRSAAPYEPRRASGETAFFDAFAKLGSDSVCYLETQAIDVPNIISGYGVVNALRAVELAREAE